MGISLDFEGRFDDYVFPYKEFTAKEHGHAEAIVKAIAYLKEKMLPVALKVDHRLDTIGEMPSEGFGKAYKDAYPEGVE